MGKSTKPVTPARRKKIIADYAECRNYSEVARKHGVSRNTVKNIVNGDPKTAELCHQKAEEHIQDAIAHLDGQNTKALKLLDKLLDAMDEKATNLDMFTTLKDIATAYGIVFDKLIRVNEIKKESGAGGSGVTIIDDL